MPTPRALLRLLHGALKTAGRNRRDNAPRTDGTPHARHTPRTDGTTRTEDKGHGTSDGIAPGGNYPGDFVGVVHTTYSPSADGDPDPGEIVWTWVPFEEDPHRGKDRPVLIVGRDGPWLLVLMLTTRDHDTEPGPQDDAWVDLGTGSWDSQHRLSEVRVDRVIRIDPAAVRREGAILDPGRFELVADSLASARG